MVDIFPFRALHYNPAKIGRDLSLVTAQPYDRIDGMLQEEYHARHPHNIIRVTKGKDEAKDSATNNKYTRARETLRRWMDEGIFVRDPAPQLYAYYQTYKTPQGTRTRKGLTAMVRTEDFGQGKIYPHEETHIGPKIDRLKLIDAARTHFESIFLLYPDLKKETTAILDRAARGEPWLQARDDYGERHAVWPISDARAIENLQRFLGPAEAIIADGHHRYETALKFGLDLKKMGVRGSGAEAPDMVLATLVNMDDAEGLTIFGTHRAVLDEPGVTLGSIQKALADLFEIRPSSLTELEGLPGTVFGLAIRGEPAVYAMVLKDRDRALKALESGASHSREWRLLDVNVLHGLVLERVLGITSEDLAHEKKIEYHRHAQDVLRMVSQGRYSIAFLVRPVRVEEIKTITRGRERFPQKTTDFYPKLLSGLLLCPVGPGP